ncbi:MAG: hypothetical protein WC752_02795 [Patescibacteria group bacterium]|jgi:hypothetical protein
MHGGKYIGWIFPRYNWGTHFVINREAYALLQKTVAGDSRFDLKKDFVGIQDINIYEELNGLDGLWFEGKLNSSTMFYNPKNGQGEAPLGIKNNFFILLKLLKKKKNPINILRVARRAAYLSHLIADSLTPCHHYGRYANLQIRYFLWLIKSDWEEEGIPHIKEGVSYEWEHFKFETKLAYKTVGKTFGPVKIFHDFVKEYLEKKGQNPLFIQNKCIGEIEKVFKMDIYPEFIRTGWTKKIEQAMTQKIMPLMISWSATFWYLALLETKLNKS